MLEMGYAGFLILQSKAGDLDSIPESGRSPGEGNGNPLQYSCLENPTNREAWRATVHGITRIGYDLVRERERERERERKEACRTFSWSSSDVAYRIIHSEFPEVFSCFVVLGQMWWITMVPTKPICTIYKGCLVKCSSPDVGLSRSIL